MRRKGTHAYNTRNALRANTQEPNFQPPDSKNFNHTVKYDNMPSLETIFERPELERSATWPSPKMQANISRAVSTPAFEDDLEQHPEKHFLTPMTAEERYGWDSDSDDEDDGGEWNAGIMDFSLFTADRKRAMETGEPLDEKWDHLLASQAEAFKRSCDRVWARENDRTPELTPDTSPKLKDNLEDDDEIDGKARLPWIQVPDYLTFEVTPSKSGVRIGPNDKLPLSFGQPRKSRIERPGLKHARTMSGRKHVWERPGYDMPTVGEDADAEAEAEREDVEAEMEVEQEDVTFTLVVAQH